MLSPTSWKLFPFLLSLVPHTLYGFLIFSWTLLWELLFICPYFKCKLFSIFGSRSFFLWTVYNILLPFHLPNGFNAIWMTLHLLPLIMVSGLYYYFSGTYEIHTLMSFLSSKYTFSRIVGNLYLDISPTHQIQHILNTTHHLLLNHIPNSIQWHYHSPDFSVMFDSFSQILKLHQC